MVSLESRAVETTAVLIESKGTETDTEPKPLTLSQDVQVNIVEEIIAPETHDQEI